MVRKLGGDDDAFISYRTGQYKLHYYETPSSLRFVLLTDTMSMSMRNVLHQIYINLWVEYGEFSEMGHGTTAFPVHGDGVLTSVCSRQESLGAGRAQRRRGCQERNV